MNFVKKAGFSCELNDITRSLEKLYDHVALEEERLVNNAEKMKQNSSQNLLQNKNVTIHIPIRKEKDRLKPVVAMEDYNPHRGFVHRILCS